MSASKHEALSGDIIEIEHTDDTTASTPTWTLIGRTTDTIELSPNVESDQSRLHESKQLDEAVVSEAWELSFSRHVTTTVAGLTALGLYDDTNGELKGSYDSRVGSENNPALQISVYENDAQRQASDAKYQLGIDEYIVKHDGAEIDPEGFASMGLVVRSLSRPKRLDQDGTLDAS